MWNFFLTIVIYGFTFFDLRLCQLGVPIQPMIKFIKFACKQTSSMMAGLRYDRRIYEM